MAKEAQELSGGNADIPDKRSVLRCVWVSENGDGGKSLMLTETVRDPADEEKTAYTLQGLRFGVETSRRFRKIQKESRTEPALSVLGPPVPHAFVLFPDLLQLDLIARERR